MTIHRVLMRAMRIAAAVTVFMLLESSAVLAASSTWDGDTDTSFLNASNWSNGVPGFATGTVNSASTNTATNDIATFYTGTPSFLTASFDSGSHRRLSGLAFTGPGDVVINGISQTRQLNLRGGSDPDADGTQIRVDGGNVLLVPDAPASAGSGQLYLEGNGTHSVWHVVDGSTLTVETRIAGGSNLTLEKTGGGTVVMGGTGAHNLSGQHIVSEGVLRFANPLISRGNSLANVTVAGGATLQLYDGGSYHNFQDQGLGSGVQMTNGNNGVLTLNGTGVGGLGALRTMVSDNFLMAGLIIGATKGSVVIASDAAIGVDDGVTLKWQHGIAGASAGTLTKVGAGTLVFDANNGLADYGYNQNIVVAQGTMLVNTQATSSSVIGNTHSGSQEFFVASTAGISVGQPVSGDGIPDGTYVHSLLGINHNQAEVLPRVVLSQAVTADASGVSLNFGGVASALSSSAVTVSSGATLGGTGSIAGSSVTIDANGTLAPGASIGEFTVGSAVINGKLAIEYSGSTIDKLVVSTPLEADFNSDGVVDAADYVVWRKDNLSSEQYDTWRATFGASSVLDISNATLEFTDMGALTAGTHVFAEYGSLVGGSFMSVVGLPAGFTIDYAFGGNKIALVETMAFLSGDTITAVPEPTSWFLFAVASAIVTMTRTSRSRDFSSISKRR